MAHDEKVVEKLRKLLAMANDGRGNETEAETALRHAEALMRKHGIESADIVLKEMQAGTLKTDSVVVDTLSGARVPKWIGYLVIGIGKLTDTIVMGSPIDGYRAGIKFCGTPEDVQMAAFLLPYLMEAIDRERKRDGVGYHVQQYRVAAALVLQKRMKDLRAERDKVFEASSSTALMVIDKKLQVIKEKFGEQETKQTKSNLTNMHVANLGAAAGKRINLSQQVGHTKQLERV